jgi:hypothetical protein
MCKRTVVSAALQAHLLTACMQIAHYEIDPSSIPAHLVSRVFALVVAMCVRESTAVDLLPLLTSSFQRVTTLLTCEYRSCLHPIECTLRSALAFSIVWAEQYRMVDSTLDAASAPTGNLDSDNQFFVSVQRRPYLCQQAHQQMTLLMLELERRSGGFEPLIRRRRSTHGTSSNYSVALCHSTLPTTTDSEPLRAIDRLRHSTLFSTAAHLGIFVVLQQIVDLLHGNTVLLVQSKLLPMVQHGQSGTATKGQLAALDKLVDSIDTMMQGIACLALLVQDCAFGQCGGQPTDTTKSLTKLLRSCLQRVQKVKSNIVAHAWQDAIDNLLAAVQQYLAHVSSSSSSSSIQHEV